MSNTRAKRKPFRTDWQLLKAAMRFVGRNAGYIAASLMLVNLFFWIAVAFYNN